MESDGSTQRMPRCRRCCLETAIKLVNFMVLLFGIGLIIYSLWLDRTWHLYLRDVLPSYSSPPTPWFIYSSLAVGIGVSLSTFCGYSVAIYTGNYTLCAYIFFIAFLLFLEAAVIFIIFFKMDLAAEIAAYFDYDVEEFEKFVGFHVKLSRVILLIILIVQVDVLGLAVVLWGIGTVQPRIDPNQTIATHFTESFLVPNLPYLRCSARACPTCGNLLLYNSPTFFSYIYSVIRAPFQTTDAIT